MCHLQSVIVQWYDLFILSDPLHQLWKIISSYTKATLKWLIFADFPDTSISNFWGNLFSPKFSRIFKKIIKTIIKNGEKVENQLKSMNLAEFYLLNFDGY